MVLPLLIISILTCLFVIMFFYETTLQQCQLHQAMRCAADDLTGHTRNLSSYGYGQSEQERQEGTYTLTTYRSGVFETVSGKEHIDMKHQGILRSRVSADLESLWHASDGVDYVRYCAIVKNHEDKP